MMTLQPNLAIEVAYGMCVGHNLQWAIIYFEFKHLYILYGVLDIRNS